MKIKPLNFERYDETENVYAYSFNGLKYSIIFDTRKNRWMLEIWNPNDNTTERYYHPTKDDAIKDAQRRHTDAIQSHIDIVKDFLDTD